jgi:hypothetical protein
MDISAYAAKLLNLQQGDVIDIMIDGEEFYLYVARQQNSILGRYPGSVSRTRANGHHFRVNSKKLCDVILCECKVSDKVRLYVGEPVNIHPYGTLLPIITRCAIYDK